MTKSPVVIDIISNPRSPKNTGSRKSSDNMSRSERSYEKAKKQIDKLSAKNYEIDVSLNDTSIQKLSKAIIEVNRSMEQTKKAVQSSSKTILFFAGQISRSLDREFNFFAILLAENKTEFAKWGDSLKETTQTAALFMIGQFRKIERGIPDISPKFLSEESKPPSDFSLAVPMKKQSTEIHTLELKLNDNSTNKLSEAFKQADRSFTQSEKKVRSSSKTILFFAGKVSASLDREFKFFGLLLTESKIEFEKWGESLKETSRSLTFYMMDQFHEIERNLPRTPQKLIYDIAENFLLNLDVAYPEAAPLPETPVEKPIEEPIISKPAVKQAEEEDRGILGMLQKGMDWITGATSTVQNGVNFVKNTDKFLLDADNLVGGVKEFYDNFKGGKFNGNWTKGLDSLSSLADDLGSLSGRASTALGSDDLSELFQSVANMGGGAGTAAAGGAGGAGAGGGAAATSGLLLPAAVAASTVAATAATVDIVGDVSDAIHKENAKEKRDAASKAVAKSSMVLAGAGAGAAIGSVIPGIGTVIGGVVGAGVGSVMALTQGDAVGEWASDLIDGTQAIRDTTAMLERTNKNFIDAREKDQSIQKMLKEYEELNKKMKEGKIPLAEQEKIQERIQAIVQNLADIYPNLVTQQDLLNGTLSVGVEKFSKMSAQERETAYYTAKKTFSFAENDLKANDTSGKLKAAKADNVVKKEKFAETDKMLVEFSLIESEYNNKVAEIKSYTQEYKGDNLFTDEGFLKLEQEKAVIVGKAEELSGKFYGSPKDYSENSNAITGLGTELMAKKDELLDAINSNNITIKEMNTAMSEQLQLKKFIIEHEYGFEGTIEDEFKNWDKKTFEEQENILRAKSELMDYQNSLEGLDDSYKINFDLVFQAIFSGSTLQELERLHLLDDYFSAKAKADFAWMDGDGKASNLAVSAKANGGYIGAPQLALIGEAGPEMIIPLSESRRERGLSLWQEAGEKMGVFPSVSEENTPVSYLSSSQAEIGYEPDGSAEVNIESLVINLGGMNFSLAGIDSSNPDSIVSSLRAQMPEIADEMCLTIASMLHKVFSNMPLVQN